MEFQPSNATDLSALREQIFKLTDEGPGGFDTFRAEFHRLMTEILATGAEDAITPRELNGIVREGIKNPTIWTLVCHQIYANDQNAPWDVTFEAISRARILIPIIKRNQESPSEPHLHQQMQLLFSLMEAINLNYSVSDPTNKGESMKEDPSRKLSKAAAYKNLTWPHCEKR